MCCKCATWCVAKPSFLYITTSGQETPRVCLNWFKKVILIVLFIHSLVFHILHGLCTLKVNRQGGSAWCRNIRGEKNYLKEETHLKNMQTPDRHDIKLRACGHAITTESLCCQRIYISVQQASRWLWGGCVYLQRHNNMCRRRQNHDFWYLNCTAST